MRFKSAVDAWFYILALALPFGILIAVASAMDSASAVELVIIAFAAVLSLGLPIWLLLGTWYQVDPDVLTIRSGPFRWTIPVNSIHSVEASRSVLASPALSLTRLQLRYGNQKSILVSPKDAQRFKNALGFAEEAAH